MQDTCKCGEAAAVEVVDRPDTEGAVMFGDRVVRRAVCPACFDPAWITVCPLTGDEHLYPCTSRECVHCDAIDRALLGIPERPPVFPGGGPELDAYADQRVEDLEDAAALWTQAGRTARAMVDRTRALAALPYAAPLHLDQLAAIGRVEEACEAILACVGPYEALALSGPLDAALEDLLALEAEARQITVAAPAPIRGCAWVAADDRIREVHRAARFAWWDRCANGTAPYVGGRGAGDLLLGTGAI